MHYDFGGGVIHGGGLFLEFYGIHFLHNEEHQYFLGDIMYRSNRSFNMPPPGIHWAFNTFAIPERREFDHQSLPGGGEFDPHALEVGNLNSTLDFM